MTISHRSNVVSAELHCDGERRLVDAAISHVYLQNNKVIRQLRSGGPGKTILLGRWHTWHAETGAINRLQKSGSDSMMRQKENFWHRN